MEADHTVRLHIGLINQVFLDAGAKAAIDRGYRTCIRQVPMWRSPRPGADLFA